MEQINNEVTKTLLSMKEEYEGSLAVIAEFLENEDEDFSAFTKFFMSGLVNYKYFYLTTKPIYGHCVVSTSTALQYIHSSYEKKDLIFCVDTKNNDKPYLTDLVKSWTGVGYRKRYYANQLGFKGGRLKEVRFDSLREFIAKVIEWYNKSHVEFLRLRYENYVWEHDTPSGFYKEFCNYVNGNSLLSTIKFTDVVGVKHDNQEYLDKLLDSYKNTYNGKVSAIYNMLTDPIYDDFSVLVNWILTSGWEPYNYTVQFEGFYVSDIDKIDSMLFSLWRHHNEGELQLITVDGVPMILTTDSYSEVEPADQIRNTLTQHKKYNPETKIEFLSYDGDPVCGNYEPNIADFVKLLNEHFTKVCKGYLVSDVSRYDDVKKGWERHHRHYMESHPVAKNITYEEMESDILAKREWLIKVGII